MSKRVEIINGILVVLMLIGVPLIVAWHQNDNVYGPYPPDAKVFTLTGFANAGIWTLDMVTASNYKWTDFEPATIRVSAGDHVVLRLLSSDVTHRFYLPSLGLGPIDVEPGHIEIVEFVADTEGAFEYYCTSICGDCHFYMSGWVLVGEDIQMPEPRVAAVCEHEIEQPPEEEMIEWGKFLHQDLGCITCHGEGGVGGIENYNYVKETIPDHYTLADKFGLASEEATDVFIDLLADQTPLEDLEETPPEIRRFVLVFNQYLAAIDLIKNGKYCSKFDEEGPDPPLQMPSWTERLTDRDIDSIIAYLLSIYPWEEDYYDESY